MPFAFLSAGASITVAILVLFTLMGLICMFYTLEALARAEGMTRLAERQTGLRDPLLTASHSDKLPSMSASVHWPQNVLAYRKFDFVRMSELFGGTPLKTFTQFSVALYCYGSLWSYAAVFSSTVSALFFQFALRRPCNIYDSPSSACQLGYRLVVALFAVYAIAMSFKDISAQRTLQQIMTGYRFAAFFVMALTAIVALYHPNTFDAAASHHAPYVSKEPNHVKWAGFGVAFSFSAVALNVQYNSPDFLTYVRAPKQHLKALVTAGLGTAVVLYIAIGWLCSSTFGSKTTPLVTLNWQHYTGLAGGWGAGSETWWAVVIKLFIMAFPALNMISVFPLLVITLAGNLETSMPASLAANLRARYSSTTIRYAFRLAAAVPPLVLSAINGKLSIIFTITGLIGFWLELIIPALLHVLSARLCVAKYGPGSERTPYTTMFSHTLVAVAIAIVGILGFFFAAFVSLLPHQANKLLA